MDACRWWVGSYVYVCDELLLLVVMGKISTVGTYSMEKGRESERCGRKNTLISIRNTCYWAESLVWFRSDNTASACCC